MKPSGLVTLTLALACLAAASASAQQVEHGDHGQHDNQYAKRNENVISHE